MASDKAMERQAGVGPEGSVPVGRDLSFSLSEKS